MVGLSRYNPAIERGGSAPGRWADTDTNGAEGRDGRRSGETRSVHGQDDWPHDGGMICYGVWLGDELGLYRELAGSGPRTADSVAAKTGCHARLVREWLDGQAAGGLVAYDRQ